LITQILVIIRKEWEEIKSSFFSYHNLIAGIWPIFLFCAAFGVYEPLRLGVDWLQSPVMVFSISVLIPFIAIGFISPYSFVGERMRGTLEPLLAAPVSDQALLFGKIGMAVLYGLGVTLANLLLGLVVINIFFAYGKVLLFPPWIMLSTLLLSLFFSILVATIGTDSSLYAKTINEAQRKLVMTIFIPILLPAVFIGPLMPEAWKGILLQVTAHLGAINPLLLLILLLLMVDCIFIIITLAHFHRKQLLLA
jgi:ABC-2 type transport system permease protein